MNRFQAVQQAILGAVGELLDRHPSLLDGLSDDDARALGREAADRAVRTILADHVPHVTPESHERHLTSPVSRSTGEKVSATPRKLYEPSGGHVTRPHPVTADVIQTVFCYGIAGFTWWSLIVDRRLYVPGVLLYLVWCGYGYTSSARLWKRFRHGSTGGLPK